MHNFPKDSDGGSMTESDGTYKCGYVYVRTLYGSDELSIIYMCTEVVLLGGNQYVSIKWAKVYVI